MLRTARFLTGPSRQRRDGGRAAVPATPSLLPLIPFPSSVYSVSNLLSGLTLGAAQSGRISSSFVSCIHGYTLSNDTLAFLAFAHCLAHFFTASTVGNPPVANVLLLVSSCSVAWYLPCPLCTNRYTTYNSFIVISFYLPPTDFSVY